MFDGLVTMIPITYWSPFADLAAVAYLVVDTAVVQAVVGTCLVVGTAVVQAVVGSCLVAA